MCVHHWVIDSDLQGRCKCGKVKNFAPKEPHALRHEVTLRDLHRVHAGFYLQGNLHLSDESKRRILT